MNTLQVHRAAFRFLCVRVLKCGWFDEEIPAPKKRLLPNTVMTAEQITRENGVANAINNRG